MYLHDYFKTSHFISYSQNKQIYSILGLITKQLNSLKSKNIEVLGIMLYNVCGDGNENN